MTTASAATPTTVVVRDSSGDFAANQITAASGVGSAAGFLGNATTADALRTARVITIDGVVNGNVSFDGSQAVTITTTYDDADITALAAMAGTGLVTRTAANTYAQRTLQVTASSGITLTNADGVSGNPTINVASTASNSANNLVLRDGNGDFAAGVITATRFTGDIDTNLIASITDTKNLRPDTNNAYYIGLSSRRYSDVYSVDGDFSGVITGNLTGDVTGNLVATATNTKSIQPDTDNSYFLGLSSLRYSDVYAVDGNFSGVITGNVTGNVTGDLVATATNTKSIQPDTDNSYYLGVSSLRYSGIYGVDGNFSGTVTATSGFTGDLTGNLVGAATDTKGIRPDTTNTYYLGLSSRRYSGIYGVAGDFSGVITASGGVTGDLTGNLVATQTLTKSIRPDTDNSYYLGLSSFRYSGIYGVDGNFSGTVTATSGFTGDVTGNVTGDVTGTVSSIANHDTDSLSEGSLNLYFTDARADARIAAATTDDLSEGVTNLYYTDARADARIAASDTDALSEGSTNLYYTDARAEASFDTKIAAASTTDLSEGNNLYYTEARVQTKLDNAFAQLQAMLNNLATTTTLTLDLSGNPVPGDVESLDAASLVPGTGYVTLTNVPTTGGAGSSLTVDIVAVAGAITSVTINSAGSGYAVGDTVTITGGNADATIDVLTILQMQVGDSVTGGTSATTGTITAIGATSVTVDNVSGFFKPTEIVSAGNVTTLSINSFA